MTNCNVAILHRNNPHGAAGAVGVRVHHQIQTGEVTNDQIGKIAEPEIVGSTWLDNTPV